MALRFASAADGRVCVDVDFLCGTGGIRSFRAGETAAGGRFELGTFRNLSGSDRRFLYRESDGKMFSDDYNRWLLSPDLMLERQLTRALSPRERGPHRRKKRPVSAVGRNHLPLRIRPGTEKKAVLSVDYTVRVYVDRRPVRTENLNVSTEQPIRGNTPAAAAAAMSECVTESIAAVRALLLEMNQDEQKAK